MLCIESNGGAKKVYTSAHMHQAMRVRGTSSLIGLVPGFLRPAEEQAAQKEKSSGKLSKP